MGNPGAGPGTNAVRGIPIQGVSQLIAGNSSDDAGAVLNQAETLYYTGRVDEAIEKYEILAAGMAQGQNGGVLHARAALKLAEHYAAIGDFSKSLPYLRNLMSKGAEDKFHLPRIQVAMLMIKVLSGMGASDEAVKVIDTLMASGGYGYGLLLRKSELFEEMGDFDGAISCLDEMLKITGETQRILPKLFEILKKTSRLDEREKEYLAIISGNSDDMKTPGYLARLYLFQDKLKDAAQVLEGLLRKQEMANIPPDPNFLLELGRISARTGDHDRAVQLLQRALTIRPGDQMTAISLFDSLMELKRNRDASEMLRDAVSRAVNLETAGEMSRHLFLRGMREEALDSYLESRQRFKSPSAYVQELMQIYGSLGKPVEATGEIIASLIAQPYRLDNIRDLLLDYMIEYEDQQGQIIQTLLKALPTGETVVRRDNRPVMELFAIAAYALRSCNRPLEGVMQMKFYSLSRGDHGYSLLTFGRELLDSDKTEFREAGLKALNLLVEEFPPGSALADGAKELSEILLKSGKAREALDIVIRGASRFPAIPGPGIQLQLERARILDVYLGQTTEAAAVLKDILSKNLDFETSAAAKTQLSKCLMRSEDFSGASDLLDQAVPERVIVEAGNTGRPLTDIFAESLFTRALCRISEKDCAGALSSLELIVQRAPGSLRATDALIFLRGLEGFVSEKGKTGAPESLASEKKPESSKIPVSSDSSDPSDSSDSAVQSNFERDKFCSLVRSVMADRGNDVIRIWSENQTSFKPEIKSACLRIVFELFWQKGHQDSAMEILDSGTGDLQMDIAPWSFMTRALLRLNGDNPEQGREASAILLELLKRYPQGGYGVPARRLLEHFEKETR
jgi:tetratricopeptide (TPR) repeat protein